MTADEQLEEFIVRFPPEIEVLGTAVLERMRSLYPTAVRLVYDNYNALAIGFGPSERASEAIFSIALYPKRVNLNFLQGGKTAIADPQGLLQGSGTVNRFITLDTVERLDDPRVRALMDQAVSQAVMPLQADGMGHTLVKSISAKQRPRR